MGSDGDRNADRDKDRGRDADVGRCKTPAHLRLRELADLLSACGGTTLYTQVLGSAQGIESRKSILSV